MSQVPFEASQVSFDLQVVVQPPQCERFWGTQVLPQLRAGLTESVPREHVQNPVAPSQKALSAHWASVEQRVVVRVGSGPKGFCGPDGTVDGAPDGGPDGVGPGFGDWARRATDGETSGLSFGATVALLVVVAVAVECGPIGEPGAATSCVLRAWKKTNNPVPRSAAAKSATTNTRPVRDEVAGGGSGGLAGSCGWLGWGPVVCIAPKACGLGGGGP